MTVDPSHNLPGSGRLENMAKQIKTVELPYFRILLISAILLSGLSLYLFISNDLHNAHFDSKGHQLVPRRIVDNLKPGWIQIGAFWLPLPHVLYLPLVKNDWIYFNGYAGIPYSVLSYLGTVLLLYKLLERVTDRTSAFIVSALYMSNTNMLYLQSTSLTENLSIFFMVCSVYLFSKYAVSFSRKTLLIASFVSALGVLVRYENWFVFGMMGLLTIVLNLKEKRGFRNLILDCAILGLLNFAAIGLSFWINWYTTGKAFVDITHKFTDFQPGQGSLFISFFVILYTLANLVSYELTVAALIAFFAMFKRKFRDPIFIASLALLGPLLLYLMQYHNGHPTRIRYGLIFVPACYFFLSYFCSRTRFVRYLFLVFAIWVNTSSYFARFASSELVEESMRDAPNIALQNDLLWYLKQNDDGTLILAAMGEVAPVLYDLKLPIKRYVHEGAKPWWTDAIKHPEKVVGWVFISQDDKLWKILHDNPEFHKHFALIGRRNYLEMYRRTPDIQYNLKSHRPHGSNVKGEIPHIPKLRR